MPDGIVLRMNAEKMLTIPKKIAEKLTEKRSGDAALLFLHLLCQEDAAGRDAVCRARRWEPERLRSAVNELSELGLLDPAAAVEEARTAEAPPPVNEALSEYSREDIMQKLQSDKSFAGLLTEVERKLGRLTTPGLSILLGIQEQLGLPTDVVYLLVNHCTARKEAQFGEGRRPTMREIEKEAYVWARHELFSTARANEYLRREEEKRARFPEYMAALRLGGRQPSPSEEQYLTRWMQDGFSGEMVALAYDRTVLGCHEFKWAYCNGVLRNWAEKGLRTPADVYHEDELQKQENARRRAEGKKPPEVPVKSRKADMKQYIQSIDRNS